MQSSATLPEQYLLELPDDRKAAMTTLRNTIKENLPKDFAEEMAYGMIGFVVPHAIYPSGYHCDAKMALPFMSIASQKNFIALYHMGIYADENLLKWFVDEYPKHCKAKLDMGKSCIRFKKTDAIPFELIAQLCQKISVEKWIASYEKLYKK